jgi:hypothetical protein
MFFMNAAGQLKKASLRTWVFFTGLLLVCVVAVNHQSLWIDETYTALKAQQTTLPNWWHEMRRAGGSDMQMPLYMIWIWVCEKFVGSSEIALRGVNLFWILPGLIALWHALARQPRLQLAVFLAAVCNPFVWYYLDEARPYAMQIGASLFLAAALCRWSEKTISSTSGESIWVWGFVVALVALSGASLLGMIWAGAAIVAAIFLSPRERLLKLGLDHVFAWLTAIALLATLGFYYLWTLKAGARASDAASTDWKNVTFIGYELLGFAGLGPGRLEIRDGGLHVFKPYAPELALFAGLVLALILYAILDLWRNYPRKKIPRLVVIIAAPAVFILVAGFVLHFRVLGRHFAPLLPVAVFLLGLGVSAAWRRSAAGKILVVGFFAFSLMSGLSLRFAPRHAKDDYRSAVGLAHAALAHGQTVWWSADANAAAYYQLPLATNSAGADKVLLMINPPVEFLATNVSVDVVIVSRPDIYDPHGALAVFLARNDFNKAAALPAFAVWEKVGGKPH